MKHRIVVAVVALAARLAVVLWAWSRIPPTADGAYYHELAMRLAEGKGYTWLWPDGAVTYAAHYPVGYPAMLAVAYAIFGAKPGVGMLVNVLVGTAGAVAAHDLATRATSARLALFAGLAVALHPALVPYSAAIMTEGVTASLLVAAAALADRGRDERVLLVAAGIVMGIATLVRPQSLLLAPVFGALAFRGAGKRALGAAIVTALALLVCAPWTARNCARMGRCALVSVNGGWNLAIGTQTTDGGWHEVAVPDACKEVWGEADKDACFREEAQKEILARPLPWLALAPKKVRMTLDYLGAAPWYLHTASPSAFPYGAKVGLGVVETLAARLLLAAALVAVWKTEGPRKKARIAVCAVGLAACVFVPGAVAYLALALAVALLASDAPFIHRATAAVVALTAATHAVFFGAGRYGLVVLPFVTVLAFVRASSSVASRGGAATFGSVDAVQAIAGSSREGREESPSSTECDAG